MALFVVRHHHAADHCPAQNPDMGAMLLNHLSRPNVRQYGVLPASVHEMTSRAR